MKIIAYDKQFDLILEGKNTAEPYDSEDYINYVKMNKARIKRWRKTGKILDELEQKIKQIENPQKWILITEPWCGDAAHSQPFIEKLAAINPFVSLEIQNRDAPGSEIDSYLTNGSKSIPMLVVRNQSDKDMMTWGPRPTEAQQMVMLAKTDQNKDPETKKQNLQRWYNEDKGKSLQQEIFELVKD